MGDAVNHPDHYGGADDPYEVIKVIEAWGLGFHLGNTVKYIARAGKKAKLVEDLKKAQWYLARKIARLEMADSKQLRDEVAEIRDTDDLWRLYTWQWVAVYTSDSIGTDGELEAIEEFKTVYQGRVRNDEWKVYSYGPKWSSVLQLRLPTMVGEFKYRTIAEGVSLECPAALQPTLVVRNSADDHRLREYGRRKLTSHQGLTRDNPLRYT